jgi:ABC-type multidrug transport system fused ATPase/permease subunit
MGKTSFGFFVFGVLIVFYFFVFQQWHFVSSTAMFLLLVFVFVVLSFLSSAFETAFSTAHTDRRIQESIEDEVGKLALRYSQIDEVIRSGQSIEALSGSQRKELRRLDKMAKKLKRKRTSLEEESRAIYVGSFASLSVFLNIALAALLPFALQDSTIAESVISLNYISSLGFSGNAITYTWSSIELGGQKTLIFFASAFPILIFGKIVPKEIGIVFNHLFAFRFNRLARVIVAVVGFIPKGMSWPLNVLRASMRKN